MNDDTSKQPNEEVQRVHGGNSTEEAVVRNEQELPKGPDKSAVQEPEIEVHAASHSIDPPTADAIDRLTTVLKDVVKAQQTWVSQQAEIVGLMRRMTEVMERNPGTPPPFPSLQLVSHSPSNRSGSRSESSSHHHHQSSSRSHHTSSGRSASSTKSSDDRKKTSSTSNDRKSDHRRSGHKDRSHHRS